MLSKLKKLVYEFGGTIKIVPEHYRSMPGQIDWAPFRTKLYLGVDWKNKTLFHIGEFPSDPTTESLGDFIHEIGHVFACKVTPEKSNEFNFFGWEYLVALQAGMTHEDFCKRNRYYGIRDSRYPKYWGDFGDHDAKGQRIIIGDMIRRGIKYGNIVKDKPVSVRKP